MATTRKSKPVEQTGESRTQKSTPASKPPRYEHSEAEKIKAVTAMLTANREHPLSVPALEAGYRALGHRVHHQTLSDWHKQYRETVIAALVLPTTSEIVQGTRDEIVDGLNDIVRGGIDHARKPETIAKANFYQTTMGIAVALTKIGEITGLPAEDVALWHDLANTAALAGVDHRQVIQDMVAWLKSRLPTIASLGKGDTPMDKADNNKPTTAGNDNS